MRLSEEIRLGSLLVQEPTAWDVRACAIGMANLSVGYVANGKYDSNAYGQILNRHRWTGDSVFPCPLGCERKEAPLSCSGMSMVHHLFDGHVMQAEMTIEQLVDWVRSVEPPDPSELLKEVDEAVGEHPEHEDVPMDMYERWERSAPERQG